MEIIPCLLASKANLRAAGGRREGGLCYYNFPKLLQMLEAVLRLFVRAQDERSQGRTFRENGRCSNILAQHFVIITKNRYFEDRENATRLRIVNLDHQIISIFGFKEVISRE